MVTMVTCVYTYFLLSPNETQVGGLSPSVSGERLSRDTTGLPDSRVTAGKRTTHESNLIIEIVYNYYVYSVCM